MRKRLFPVAAVIVAASTVAALTNTLPGHASPAGPDPLPAVSQDALPPGERSRVSSAPNLDPSLRALMAAQDRATTVLQKVRSVRPTAASGFAGSTLDRDRMRLFWHGDVPEQVHEILRTASAAGVQVSLEQAPYTEAELLAEADRMSRRPVRSGDAAGRRSLQVAPRPDGTGLDVAVAGLPPGMTEAEARRTVPALDTDLPITFTHTDFPAFASRYFDNAPYYGGALMVRDGVGNSCSSGFGVRGNNGAATYILSAAHCGTGTWETGTVQLSSGENQTRTIGNTISGGRDTGRDIQLVLAPSGGGVYWGASINPPTSAGSNSYVDVESTTANQPGATVCHSGAYSGTQCNAQIVSVNNTITIEPALNGVSRITRLVQTQSTDNTAFAGQGDSGGPVTSVAANGTVRGRGIVSAIRTGSALRTCKGYNYQGRQCSWITFYADLQEAEFALGVQTLTQ